LSPSRGFMSCNEPLIHLGLGEATEVDGLTITWPSGTVQKVGQLGAGKLHTIEEEEAGVVRPAPARPRLEASTIFGGIAHLERP
ncbi:MAG: hypothetical protein GWO24_30970, partial [Akkermansiaceae bacterium]|nr:hypothetical protein [Akkermansiaceae bacterium]